MLINNISVIKKNPFNDLDINKALLQKVSHYAFPKKTNWAPIHEIVGSVVDYML